MLQLEVLVGELLAVDALAAGAVVVREVASLQHEVRDHAVERAALVAVAFLHCAKRKEVISCLGDHIFAKLLRKYIVVLKINE